MLRLLGRKRRWLPRWWRSCCRVQTDVDVGPVEAPCGEPSSTNIWKKSSQNKDLQRCTADMRSRRALQTCTPDVHSDVSAFTCTLLLADLWRSSLFIPTNYWQLGFGAFGVCQRDVFCLLSTRLMFEVCRNEASGIWTLLKARQSVHGRVCRLAELWLMSQITPGRH